ncbi:MAG TPA: fatty acid desaturase family protein [Acidimicrobiia bacterium]|nr:fatty acid desaturase family protein [Acidimicrobiia bacterium]
MARSGAVSERPLGGMQPSPTLLTGAHETALVRADGRPRPAFREELRRIPSWRNAASVLFVWVEVVGVIALAAWWGNPVGYVLAFLLVGRADAQFAALMHEAAHRLLFANRRLNDVVGRWVVGYPIFTSTDAYRRVHMAHHRHEFGPDEPDIPLYAGYPISHASFRRKLVRDVTGQTAVRLFREQFAPARWKDARARRTLLSILLVQAVLLGAAIAAGKWWLYPLLWLLPYMTVWRVINRLRAIAEHGGMDESSDRRETTHTVRQHLLARFWLVPYHIGWHLAHHVDAGIPMRALPRYHDALCDAGYVTPELEYRTYPALWKALRAG